MPDRLRLDPTRQASRQAYGSVTLALLSSTVSCAHSCRSIGIMRPKHRTKFDGDIGKPCAVEVSTGHKRILPKNAADEKPP